MVALKTTHQGTLLYRICYSPFFLSPSEAHFALAFFTLLRCPSLVFIC